MTGVLIKRGDWTPRHAYKEDDVKTQGEHPQGMPEATRSWERAVTDSLSLTALRKNRPCSHTAAPKYPFTLLCLALKILFGVAPSLFSNTALPRPSGQSLLQSDVSPCQPPPGQWLCTLAWGVPSLPRRTHFSSI